MVATVQASLLRGFAGAVIASGLLSGCAPQPVSEAPPDSLSCEILIAPTPHVTSTHVVGKERLERIHSLSSIEVRDFYRTLTNITDRLLQWAIGPDSGWTIESQRELIGGYEGLSIPSVVVQLESNGTGRIDEIKWVVAALGYVYIQDSALMICDDDGLANDTDATNLIVVDAGRRAFLSESSAELLFGMMIGLNNGADGLGYSFFPKRKTFETLEFDSQTRPMTALMRKVSQQVASLSNNQVVLDVTSRPVEVVFPGNDWAMTKNGESYMALLDGVDHAMLQTYREQFLLAIDNFATGEQTN